MMLSWVHIWITPKYHKHTIARVTCIGIDTNVEQEWDETEEKVNEPFTSLSAFLPLAR